MRHRWIRAGCFETIVEDLRSLLRKLDGDKAHSRDDSRQTSTSGVSRLAVHATPKRPNATEPHLESRQSFRRNFFFHSAHQIRLF
jgi:hypothetical protein